MNQFNWIIIKSSHTLLWIKPMKAQSRSDLQLNDGKNLPLWTDAKTIERIIVCIAKHIHLKSLKGDRERYPNLSITEGLDLKSTYVWHGNDSHCRIPAAHLKSAELGAKREFLGAISTIWPHGSCYNGIADSRDRWLPQRIWRDGWEEDISS